MEKRLVLAIALSLLIMLSWLTLVNKTQPIGNKQVTQPNTSNISKASSTALPAALLPQAETAKEFVTFKQDNREIIFDVAKAAISEVIFKVNLDHSLPLVDGFYSDGNNAFKVDKITKDSISFVYQDQDKHIFKEFSFPKDSYAIELKIQTRNLSPSPLILTSHLTLGMLDLSAKNPQSRYYGVFMGGGEKNLHLGAGKEFSSQNVKFIGLRDQYFCAIVEPVPAASSGYIKKLSGQESEVGIQEKEINLKPGDQIGQLYHIYLGPQDIKTINNIKPEWSAIIYYGTFDFIAQLLLQLLGFFYSIVHNWGLAIIILSLVVYLALFPLTLKQMRSMKEMQLLQPKIEALRNELKNNPQRLNKEIMELYKEHKVNPLGGCLPLLLQMPIFFALYQALIRSVALRGARFLWIKDLSAPDHFLTLKNSIPFLGNYINILPILMAIGMFVQQKISMAKATGEAAQQQKMMSIIMPIMFGVIFYQMPSGLVLYWFMNSALMLAYQFRINSQK
ncbi:membrane protein insertase YidC [bacterium]|nr:MAG: membrane protein insertase YidC [bacterium]